MSFRGLAKRPETGKIKNCFDCLFFERNDSEDMRMVSGLTRNQLPGNRLRVRIPCPPLNFNLFLIKRSGNCLFLSTESAEIHRDFVCRLRRCSQKKIGVIGRLSELSIRTVTKIDGYFRLSFRCFFL